jgi:hypothetical protein
VLVLSRELLYFSRALRDLTIQGEGSAEKPHSGLVLWP